MAQVVLSNLAFRAHVGVDLSELIKVIERCNLNVVMLSDQVDDLSVIVLGHQSQSKTICTETTRPTHSMEEVLVVRVRKAALHFSGNVVVHDEIDLGHIDSSRQHISRDQRREEALSEVIDDDISFFRLKTADKDLRLDVARLKSLLQLLCCVLSINENHCHGALQSRVKSDDEVNFLGLSHLHLVVLNTL